MLAAYNDLLRLTDEVGEPRAANLCRQWARQWWRATGICPYCGERGAMQRLEPTEGELG
ncbi:MAG: hypothetical protein HY724_08275 [Candidatus Rokubacteria bacterium]|nr:hypothetical protein [Candidatus Rokubacteria bacterium]